MAALGRVAQIVVTFVLIPFLVFAFLRSQATAPMDTATNVAQPVFEDSLVDVVGRTMTTAEPTESPDFGPGVTETPSYDPDMF
eukprot:CAMPEP_0198333434 /NCGR_PEP_ID=MMETSP1450-20131203/18950_1 /TAXON_ID=753684 ORGANISM="Madagascaria erythrocladiodes, Strain CCMP3234" /NCGR_SAMPLE_ID=MMETSP1450 /ASSEMBLY_ACC=CAM_ASM_001115 /LENGTH=82 /DNA_ID=CAMNT_0044037949 /DNA_START=557 /DNA_END=805 /DNA_ORIENTATION=+